MNTTENNKIIAEFLGISHQKMAMNFNSNWNLLMEVVEKIKQKYCFANINISTGETSISIFDINGENHFTTCPKNNYEGATMLSVTYKAVVNFIEWSNEQILKS